MKKSFVSVLSLVLVLGFSAKPSYAEIHKETKAIVEQVCQENSKAKTNVNASAVSWDIQRIMGKYDRLSPADKKNVQKIFQQIQSNERKKSIKSFFKNAFDTVLGVSIFGVICVAAYYIAPLLMPIDN